MCFNAQKGEESVMAKAKTREDIIKFLQDNYPKDYNILEIAQNLRIHRNTAFTYVKILLDEGKITISRTIGNSNMYTIP
ncbi:MAG: hypothetical protein ACFFFT_00210 [Candidatus Thorarchaeota archaeon]